ncbi:hypothetical protein M5689_005617 [Euphorbia peplus]|nr:hypothetical protein M5689_005617 [Euphorbia peplus]
MKAGISYVYSLKPNSWKTIPGALDDPNGGPFRQNAMMPSHATVLNGKFHFIFSSSTNYCEIVAFDASNETFEKLQLPQHVPLLCRVESLLEHKGCLCVSYRNYTMKSSTPVTDIWMMKEYGGNWVHLLTIKKAPLLAFLQMPVLCISTRNEVVFHSFDTFSKCERGE